MPTNLVVFIIENKLNFIDNSLLLYYNRIKNKRIFFICSCVRNGEHKGRRGAKEHKKRE